MNELKNKLTVCLTTNLKPLGRIAIIALFLAQAVPSFAALIRVTSYDQSHRVLAYMTFEYNASGLQSKVTSYNASGQRTSYQTNEYDTSGKISKSSSYDASGQLRGYYTYEYNTSGLRSRGSSYDKSGQLTSYYTLEYNVSGLQSKTLYYDSSSQLTSYSTYEYNTSGLRSKFSYYNESGQLQYYITYEYNASSQIIRSSSYNASDQLQSYSANEYNTSGLLSKFSNYNASGQLSNYNIYEYSAETTVATPSFSPVPGTYTTAQSVTLSCTTPGATIRYTTDNTEPNAGSAAYTSPIGVSTTTTIKAKGFKSGLTASATATGLYTMPASDRPVILINYGNFGLRTNQFWFTVIGATDMVIVVETCADLANPAWFPLQTNALTGGSFYFNDSQWTNYPTRFYRLRSP